MVRFVLIVSVLLSVMVAPDRLGSNVMTAPLAALVMADRSVPGPLSAGLVTMVCAEAINRPNCMATAMKRPLNWNDAVEKRSRGVGSCDALVAEGAGDAS